MIAQKLKKAVVKEALRLRKHATKEEKESLVASLIIPDHMFRCIYGTMTGSCNNYRAKELKSKCTVPYSSSIDKFEKTKDIKFDKFYCFSPIEFYINQEGAKLDDLVGLIKS